MTIDESAPLPMLRRSVLLIGLVLLGLAVLLDARPSPSRRPAGRPSRLDDGGNRLMIDLRWPPFVDFSKALSTLFGTAFDWPFRAADHACSSSLRRRWLALAAWVLTVAISEVVHRPRSRHSRQAAAARVTHRHLRRVLPVRPRHRFGRHRHRHRHGADIRQATAAMDDSSQHSSPPPSR